MAPLTLDQKCFIVENYSKTKNFAEVRRLFRKEFKFCPTEVTISNIVKKFRETGSVNNKKPSGRPKSARTEKIIQMVKETFEKSPSKSISGAKTELGISATSVKRILREDLKMESFLAIRRMIRMKEAQNRKAQKKVTPDNKREFKRVEEEARPDAAPVAPAVTTVPPETTTVLCSDQTICAHESTAYRPEGYLHNVQNPQMFGENIPYFYIPSIEPQRPIDWSGHVAAVSELR